MPDLERECIVWCPKCQKDWFEVHRKPTSQTGVYENVVMDPFDKKYLILCDDCGVTLERRPA